LNTAEAALAAASVYAMFFVMSENMQTAMFEILKSIQAKLVEHDRRFDAFEDHFAALEDLIRKQRRDTAGLLVMAKSVTGQFAEELAAVEERVRVLEARGR
jgi:cysteine synthase